MTDADIQLASQSIGYGRGADGPFVVLAGGERQAISEELYRRFEAREKKQEQPHATSTR